MSIVWLDGELVDKADAKVGVADHAVLFGDRISVDMRAYNGRVFGLRQHLQRLVYAANDHRFMLPVAGDALAAAIDATLKANNRTEGFVKVIITRGAGPLTLDPRKCVPVTIILAEEAAPFPRELYECGLDVATTHVPFGRPWLKGYALTRGCLEALLRYTPGDFIHGGSETDVGWVADGQIWVADSHVTTPDAVAALANAVRRTPTYDELLSADEVFLTSAAAEIIAVRSIDGKQIGSGGEGPVVRRLREAFRTLVRAECAVS